MEADTAKNIGQIKESPVILEKVIDSKKVKVVLKDSYGFTVDEADMINEHLTKDY